MKVQELAKISSMIREATREAINLYNADKTGLIGIPTTENKVDAAITIAK